MEWFRCESVLMLALFSIKKSFCPDMKKRLVRELARKRRKESLDEASTNPSNISS